MISDEEGFLYPNIDKNLCIECGICENICQSKNLIRKEREPIAYACWNNDELVLKNSSSGGIFYSLARFIIEKDGVVFGAAFDEKLGVCHIGIESVDGIIKLQGSKYVQSVIGNTYVETKKVLDEGRYVLFTGTPCQIDGLLHFLKRDYDKLFTQDMICHGVPSSLVWERYIRYQEKRFNGTLKREPLPSFREKEEGWKRYAISLHFDKDIAYRVPHDNDFYFQAFLRNMSLRPSCYECSSKGKMRNSDITLADFWGVDDNFPELFNDKGTSLVMINSAKGHELFNDIKNELTYQEVDLDKALTRNRHATKSAIKSDKRDDFFSHLPKMRFDRLVKRETLPPRYVRIYEKVRYYISALFRKLRGCVKANEKS